MTHTPAYCTPILMLAVAFMQLREANFTTRLYSPASTAAVDLQLSYYHRVRMAPAWRLHELLLNELCCRPSTIDAQAARHNLVRCVNFPIMCP